MHDLKFASAWFNFTHVVNPSELRSECLLGITETFNRNMKRAHTMVTSIPWFVGRMQLHIRSLMLAKMVIQKDRIDVFDANVSEEEWPKITKFSSHVIKKFNEDDADLMDRTWQLYSVGSAQFNAAITNADLGDVDKFAESLLLVMILNSWSAFEILATDLWIAAVNFGDESFAANVGGLSRKDSKSFTYAQIHPHIDNLRNRLGTLLVEAERVKMDCFRQIKENYKLAFGKVLEELFELHKGNPANILVLESLRNLLMHRGEVVDSDFETQVKEASGCTIPYLLSLKEGDIFLVDGHIAGTLTYSVLQFGSKLIRIMDEIITPDDAWNLSSRNPANIAGDWVI
ncbi:hypothetical protein [Roseimicrobium sp. ORNL1]|uniref:hypothetical protein n=1 Tax=Roseimicrobium sp. ORNL1 TaxID=2711231 RepID=UPI0013E1723F|nr:hypothetical protein [Roseimicrobium sp. ORNL1]QIF01811.1 hypothetical protein G5S37_09820 [Roseimicrobium sp. ORNL1]